MKKKLFMLLFLLAGSIWGSSAEKLPDLALKIETTLVSFESPIMRKNDQYMIPLREALPYFNAKMTYDRKEGSYSLSTPKMTLVFSPNVSEFTLNFTKKTFKNPPFYEGNVLYMPLDEWLAIQDLNYEEKENRLIVKSLNIPVKSPPHAQDTDKNPEKDVTDAAYTLNWGTQHYALEDVLIQEGALWANIEEILEQEGYTLTFKRLNVTLTKGKETLTFPLLNSDSVFIRKNGHFYTHLSAFFPALKLGFAKKKNQTYSVLNPIYSAVINPLGTSQLHILSLGPLEGSPPLPLAKENGFYIDIPNSLKQGPPETLTLSPPFLKAELRALDATTTRLTVWLQANRQHSPLIPTPFGAEIRAYNDIVSLRELSPNLIQIRASQPILYSVGLFDHPHRLVLDIPDSVSTLPGVAQVPKGLYYTRVRSSQFQVNPSITRIVFDLTQSATFSIQKKGKALEINFNLPTANTLPLSKPVHTPVAVLPLENRVIVIDPGHGGSDPGALSSTQDYEKEFTLDISKRLQTLLTENGAFVIMCREGDQNPSLEERTVLANMNKTDAFISVHINSFFNPFISGTETYYYKAKDELLSSLIHNELVKTLGAPNKGVKKARLYVLRNSTMPATLVEPLFITNDHDFKLLKQPEMRQKMAEAITKGVLRYFKR